MNDFVNDESVVNNKNWDKLIEKASKTGIRDGLDDGRNLNFQQYFDTGYEQGFKNAFILGLYKATLSNHNLTLTNLAKTSRGNCIVCNKEEKGIEETITQQLDSTNNILLELQNENTCNLTQKLE